MCSVAALFAPVLPSCDDGSFFCVGRVRPLKIVSSSRRVRTQHGLKSRLTMKVLPALFFASCARAHAWSLNVLGSHARRYLLLNTLGLTHGSALSLKRERERERERKVFFIDDFLITRIEWSYRYMLRASFVALGCKA
jgi:hypothetical protein